MIEIKLTEEVFDRLPIKKTTIRFGRKDYPLSKAFLVSTEISRKVEKLFTTPIISNEAFYAGARPAKPEHPDPTSSTFPSENLRFKNADRELYSTRQKNHDLWPC